MMTHVSVGLGGMLTLAMLVGGCAKPIVVPPLQDPASTGRLPGAFVWHDLLTPDPEGARRFYGELFGWEFTEAAEGRYLIIQSDGRNIGGIVDAGMAGVQVPSAFWLCGVSCPDLDATVVAFEDRGGKAVRGPADLPERGRVAIVLDAEGAPIQLIDSSSGDPPDRERVVNRWIWHELVSNAPDRAATFYAEVLGYELDSVETDDDQLYRVLETGGHPRAGIVENPFEDTSPGWVPYVLVEDLSVAAQRATALGGTVVIEPQSEIRDGTLALVLDPMGAPIALQRYEEGH